MGKMEINGAVWIKESDAEYKEVVTVVQGESIASNYIGERVIVRTRNEGINAGVVVAADATGVVLSEARRIWYHKPADSTKAWYEGVAVSGLSADSKVSCTVSKKVFIEDYSLTICEDAAFSSIMSKVPHASN